MYQVVASDLDGTPVFPDHLLTPYAKRDAEAAYRPWDQFRLRHRAVTTSIVSANPR